MKQCKICGEKLQQHEFSTGTCKDCEAAVSKIVVQKIIKGLHPKKSLKFN